jgi:hypothetical protein
VPTVTGQQSKWKNQRNNEQAVLKEQEKIRELQTLGPEPQTTNMEILQITDVDDQLPKGNIYSDSHREANSHPHLNLNLKQWKSTNILIT